MLSPSQLSQLKSNPKEGRWTLDNFNQLKIREGTYATKAVHAAHADARGAVDASSDLSTRP